MLNYSNLAKFLEYESLSFLSLRRQSPQASCKHFCRRRRRRRHRRVVVCLLSQKYGKINGNLIKVNSDLIEVNRSLWRLEKS